MKEPELLKLPFTYRATVVWTEKTGKIRIRVYGLHDGIAREDLPVAEPALDLFVAGNDAGMVSIPDVGSDVWIFFDGGNIMSPVYFAKATTASEHGGLTSEGRAVMKVPEGTTLEIESAGVIIIKGQTILLN